MDEQPAQKKQEDGAPERGIPTRSDPGPPPKPKRRDQENKPRSFRERFEWYKPHVEFAVAVCAIAGLIAVFWQLREMSKANELTERNLRLAEDSLKLTRESNQSSGEDTKRTQELMAESNRITREALEESKRQSEASRKQSARDSAASLAESRRQSTESLRIARESLRRAEGALVNIDQVHMTLTAGQPLSIRVDARNIGRSAAENPHPVCAAALWRRPESKAETYLADQVNYAPIGPGQVFSFNCVFSTLDLNGGLFADLRSSLAKLQVFAEVGYDDSFGGGEGYSCYDYNAPKNGLTPCRQGEPFRGQPTHPPPP